MSQLALTDTGPLPHNLDAEQELLGSILVNNEAYHRVSGFLSVEHFYNEAHRRIFEAIAVVIERRERADPVTLKAQFERDELLAEIGGPSYLARLALHATTVIGAEDYARVVKDLATRREIAIWANSLAREALDAKVKKTSADLAGEANAGLSRIVETGLGDSIPIVHIFAAVKEGVEEADRRHRGEYVGVQTRIPEVDDLLGVLEPGDLAILGGRPSMGKTALALGMALNMARAGDPVLFFSLEMSNKQLGQRSLSNASGVTYRDMRSINRLSTEQIADLVQISGPAFSAMPFYLVTNRSIKLGQIEALIRTARRRHGIKAVFLDYLGLVRPGNHYKGDRTNEINEISAGLKGVAGDQAVPIIALSQLNRNLENRPDKRPQMNDLRDGGGIEQDADIVMFTYRDEYYLERAEPKTDTPEWFAWSEKLEMSRGVMEVIIPKVRQGQIGTAKVFYDAATNSFNPIATRARIDHRQGQIAFEPPSHAT